MMPLTHVPGNRQGTAEQGAIGVVTRTEEPCLCPARLLIQEVKGYG
jgi:hypothetical protein